MSSDSSGGAEGRGIHGGSHPAQPKIIVELLARLRPRWRRDPGLAARIEILLRSDRRRGARDRRLYRELIYTALRHLPWIEPWLDRDPARAAKILAWLAAETPATRSFRVALAGDWPAAPADLAGRAAFLHTDPADLLPAWFRAHCPEVFAPAELDVQMLRGPLWLRLQTDYPKLVFAEFEKIGWPWRRSQILGTAVRVLAEADVTKTEAYRSGKIEVQDVGSQLVLTAADPRPGGRWLDACAGAGGKTLQLARLLGPKSSVDAHDVRPAALAELAIRAGRGGVGNVRIRPRLSPDLYEGVLVDAPCTGSGTWRRAPHLKWCTTEEDVRRAAARQLALLSRFAAFVAPQGRLVYATCSLSGEENEKVVESFLEAHPEFTPEPGAGRLGFIPRGAGFLLLPSIHDSDGFFVAMLSKR
jgi:16S rRNA (cytosine967-C5)-methyltransferase